MRTDDQHQTSAVEMIANAFMLAFISAENLAERFGFDTDEDGLQKFKKWTYRVGIPAAPKRPGFYDPKAVREALDAFYRPTQANDNQPDRISETPMSLTEQRRLRNAQNGK